MTKKLAKLFALLMFLIYSVDATSSVSNATIKKEKVHMNQKNETSI